MEKKFKNYIYMVLYYELPMLQTELFPPVKFSMYMTQSLKDIFGSVAKQIRLLPCVVLLVHAGPGGAAVTAGDGGTNGTWRGTK